MQPHGLFVVVGYSPAETTLPGAGCTTCKQRMAGGVGAHHTCWVGGVCRSRTAPPWVVGVLLLCTQLSLLLLVTAGFDRGGLQWLWNWLCCVLPRSCLCTSFADWECSQGVQSVLQHREWRACLLTPDEPACGQLLLVAVAAWVGWWWGAVPGCWHRAAVFVVLGPKQICLGVDGQRKGQGTCAGLLGWGRALYTAAVVVARRAWEPGSMWCVGSCSDGLLAL